MLHAEFAEITRSTRLHIIAGAVTCGILVLGFGGWAVLTAVDAAVIAPGTVVVESDKRRVQHQDGGIVASVAVSDGDRVKAGDVLIRLDETQLAAEFGMVRKRMSELLVRRKRLVAELEGQTLIDGRALLPEGETDGADAGVLQVASVQAMQFRVTSRDAKSSQGAGAGTDQSAP